MLIKLAWYPAPKPLSIFTTDTPEAQLLSMHRRAARPPKLAPYPTLVGTAITGQDTSPPTTLAKRPFHAGHDNRHGGFEQLITDPKQPVNTGHAHIVEPVCPVAKHFGGNRGFLRYRQIRGSGANHGDIPLFFNRPGFDHDNPGHAVVFTVGDDFLDAVEHILIGAGCKDVDVMTAKFFPRFP